MKALLEEIARGLVDNPDQVSVEELPSEGGGLVLRLSVAGEDRGKLIGRQGRTVRALRALLSAVARKSGSSVSLEIGK